MFRRKKVLCIVLVFHQVDIIKKSLNFITQYSDRLDIVVLENRSQHTPIIKRYIEGLGRKGLIKRYYLFNKNGGGNSVITVFDKELKNIRKSSRVIITDGDLISKDRFWLDEELNILKNNPEVFACGISLDMSNLPTKAYPEAISWIPPDYNEHPDYYETKTGGHLLMMRGREFADYIDWKNKNNITHIDGVMHKYCDEVLHKKWGRTKNSKAYHLTWDLYADRNHPYTKLRDSKSFEDTWLHKEKVSYKLFEY